MYFNGLLIGAGAFIIIGIFHPIVIGAEYHFGKSCWPIFFILGLLCCVGSLFLQNATGSALLSVLGFTLFWSIRELYEQEERVLKGWYPANPRRSAHQKETV